MLVIWNELVFDFDFHRTAELPLDAFHVSYRFLSPCPVVVAVLVQPHPSRIGSCFVLPALTSSPNHAFLFTLHFRDSNQMPGFASSTTNGVPLLPQRHHANMYKQ